MFSGVKRALTVVAVAAACAGTTVSAQSDDSPIRIGAIYITSGVAASYGEFARQGLQLAVDEINDDGGVLGRPLEFTLEDSEGKADVGIQTARKLVYQKDVDLLMGLDSSGVASAVIPTVPQLQTPFIITHAGTPDVTGKLCNRYTFRVSDNVAQHQAAAARIAVKTGAQRWTTVGQDYAFGHQSWEYFEKALSDIDEDAEFMDETAFPPFGNEDFTPYINRVMEAEPDGVLVSLWGGDLINFIRQADQLDFFDQDFHVLLTLGGATEVLTALGENMPEGVWVGTRYWFDAHDNDMNNRFVKSYVESYGHPPSYNAEGAYAAAYAYKAAIEEAGSTDADAVIDALTGMTFMAPTGDLTLRAGDHQAVIGPTWGKTAEFNEDLGVRMLEPLTTFAGENVTPPVTETGCDL